MPTSIHTYQKYLNPSGDPVPLRVRYQYNTINHSTTFKCKRRKLGWNSTEEGHTGTEEKDYSTEYGSGCNAP